MADEKDMYGKTVQLYRTFIMLFPLMDFSQMRFRYEILTQTLDFNSGFYEEILADCIDAVHDSDEKQFILNELDGFWWRYQLDHEEYQIEHVKAHGLYDDQLARNRERFRQKYLNAVKELYLYESYY